MRSVTCCDFPIRKTHQEPHAHPPFACIHRRGRKQPKRKSVDFNSTLIRHGWLPHPIHMLPRSIISCAGRGLPLTSSISRTFPHRSFPTPILPRSQDAIIPPTDPLPLAAVSQRVMFRNRRERADIQPSVAYDKELLPTWSCGDNVASCVCTKLADSSVNKNNAFSHRCPVFAISWTPEGRGLVAGNSQGEFTLWDGYEFNFITIWQVYHLSLSFQQGQKLSRPCCSRSFHMLTCGTRRASGARHSGAVDDVEPQQ